MASFSLGRGVKHPGLPASSQRIAQEFHLATDENQLTTPLKHADNKSVSLLRSMGALLRPEV
jgi:hypothetical protein